MDGIPHPGRDRPEQRQGHDQDEAGHALGALNVTVLQAEAPGLEVAEQRLDAPSQAVINGTVGGGRFGEGDDPGSG